METAGSERSRAGSPWLPRLIAALAFAAGAALRIVEYARNRPLWLDEAMLALNTATRSFSDLARPLDYDQTAPLLYLWLSRLAVVVGGVGERSLRFVPFVAGIVLLAALWLLVRRVVDDTAAALALVLAALSHALVAYSVEAKQYGVDPLATVLVVGLAYAAARAPADRRRWVALAVGGALSLLLSQPAAFTLGGAGLALVVTPRVRRDPATLRWLGASIALWLSTFAMLYATIYHSTASSGYMRAFWAGTFPDFTAPDLGARLTWFANALFLHPLPAPASYGWALPATAAWLAGVILLAHRAPLVAGVVTAPIVLLAGAAVAKVYPVMDRLYLFAAPLVLIAYAALIAAAVDATVAALRAGPRNETAGGASRVPLAMAVALVVVAAAPHHLRHLARPVWYGVSRHVIADVDSMSRGDAVYVAARSFPLWLFYTTDWRAPDVARLAWAANVGGEGQAAHNNAPPRGRVARGDGASLQRAYRGRTEMVGLPTGRQLVTSTRTMDPSVPREAYALPLEPDSGWAANEVHRVASVARARAWIFGSHMFALDGAEPGLVAELQRAGVRLLMERRQGTTVAYHVEFPGSP